MIAAFLAVLAATAVPSASATLAPEISRKLTCELQHKGPLACNAPWLTHTFAGIFVAAALLLVVMLALQTTKQEGLSGTIGGRMESAYRGRLGGDQQIARWTTYIATTFILFGTLLSLTGI